VRGPASLKAGARNACFFYAQDSVTAMRLFFALQPDPATRDTLAALAVDVAAESRGRAIPADNIHLTLAFLGEQSAARAHALASVVDSVDAVPCVLALDRIGTFGASRVAWIAPGIRCESLFAMQHGIAAAIRSLGLALEDRPWSPHVTLARKSELRVQRMLAEPIRWHALRLALMVSEMRSRGVLYRELKARMLD
jgi:2'-5' RNA ligase